MSDSPVHVVLGATGGIGAELCRQLARARCRLVIGARDGGRLTALADELRDLGASGIALAATEATQSGSVEGLVGQAREAFGRLDGAVCCVGSILLKPAHLTTDDEWSATLGLNLSSAFYLLRAAVRAMTGPGAVVLVSSAAARLGLLNHEAIAAAKAGVQGLVLAAAASYAGRGIRVNAIAPGLVRTPLTARLTANEASLRASTALHPLGRVGEPAEVASAIAWLLAPAQGWVTGQVLGVDGGLGTVRSRG